MRIKANDGMKGSGFIRLGKIWEKIAMEKGAAWIPNGVSEGIILFVTKGSLRITVNGFQDMLVSHSHAIFIPSNTLFKLKALEDAKWINCYFSLDSLLSTGIPLIELGQYCDVSSSYFNQLSINDSLSFFLATMDDYLSDGEFTSSFFNNKKMELFSLLFARYSKQELAAFWGPVIGDGIMFREFIYNNFMKVKDLSQFASLANYSLSGFIKRFQRYFKESPYKWISQKKGELIFYDIQSDRMSLQEIAYKYHFVHYSHFTRFCKKQLGMTPSEILNNKNRRVL